MPLNYASGANASVTWFKKKSTPAFHVQITAATFALFLKSPISNAETVRQLVSLPETINAKCVLAVPTAQMFWWLIVHQISTVKVK